MKSNINDMKLEMKRMSDLVENRMMSKNKEYGGKEEALKQFYDIARNTDSTPPKVCHVLLSKHLGSIAKIVHEELAFTEELLDEKIGDAIAYLHLLNLSIKETLRSEEIDVANDVSSCRNCTDSENIIGIENEIS